MNDPEKSRDVDPSLAPTASPDGPDTRTTVVNARFESIERDAENQGAVSLAGGDFATGGERYESGPVLGEGGMGEVRLFRDRRIGRSVARKTLHADRKSERSRRRFLREARVQGQLEHPSIVPVYDLESAPDGTISFTMRRIRGLTLTEVIAGLRDKDPAISARFSRRKLLTAFSSVCLAVHYAHTRGVIHRDLKPANIMLGPFGEVYVLDWGLVKVAGARDESDSVEEHGEITEQGAIMGTVGYMAPEQLQARGQFDARTDVYALGSILFEIVALEPLFASTLKLAQFIAQVLSGFDARPSQRIDDVAPDLDAICVKATAVKPEDRYATARELADAVDRHLDGDRDLQRRREIAREHVTAAEAASARALAAETSVTEASAAREEALNHALQALALDPKQTDARNAMLKLFVEVPKQMPPEAEAEMAQNTARVRREGARFGWWSYVSWLLTLPLVLMLGVRSWPAVLAPFLLTAASAVLARDAVRRNGLTYRHVVALALTSFGCIGLLSCWLGPFVLVPTAAAINTIVFVMHAERRERWFLVLLGALATALPFAFEALHLATPAWVFRAGTLVLNPRAVGIPPTLTLVALLYSSVMFAVLPAVFLSRIRDALSEAERQRFLHAWYLKRLVT